MCEHRRHRTLAEHLDYCDVTSVNCANPSAWTFGQWRHYWNAQFKATKEEACKAYVETHKFTPPLTALQKAVTEIQGGTGDPLSWYCVYDYDQNGTASNDWDHAHSSIHMVTEPAEPMCSLKPNGPYKALRIPTRLAFGPGLDFAETTKNLVLATNKGLMNNNTSDAWDLSANGQPHLDYFDPLYQGGPVYDQTPQIDHIIPRVDIKGCACGPNTSANALVISAKLNGEMSNNSAHPTRQAILQFYATSGTPRETDDTTVIDPSFDGVENESEIGDETTAGCSAGAGGGIAGIGVALLGLRRRRAK